MSAPKEILKLVDQFDRNIAALKSGVYNETQLRREYLDPFFKALGWDMDNTQGLAEAYKDVIHEDAIRIGGAVKAPDYGFRIGGTRKFFLEAKKPSADIGGEVPPAYQLRRYAWSAHLPLSILSDFEELAVYDCRIKPKKNDSAATARVFLCGFRDYPEKWDWIASIFAKDAILKGSFDKYAETNKAKRGTTEVDDDFLATIEGWRSDLARNIAVRNPELSRPELNFAVQRVIDRIIFLRISEDRGIEPYGRLLGLINGPNIYRRLGEVFEDADGKYNSGLFHFETEKGRIEPPDKLTLRLDIDDKILRDLLKGLYYPESPYEFTVISSDILGHVYEQFLGKVIRLTAGHHAVVEDKPEVKKAGGVYYTPTYIVDYIVRQTVGKLVDGKTPKQVSKLRVLDPACGSGSFLINAYQFLLDWNRDWYLAHSPEKWAKGREPVLVQTTSGWKLTISERKRILLDHIYGVDIDPQAVEVTKLSLLLKVLEGESEQTIQPFLRLFQQRALPDLGNNIKCGNSLIGPDFYRQKDLPDLSDEDRLRINVFDWDAEFPEIMKQGGFDAVIGNPPYGATLSDIELDYFFANFETPTTNVDTYQLFLENAIHLASPNGYISMIVPTGWYSGPTFSSLRRFYAITTDPAIFINLPYDIFKAWIDTTIFVTKKRSTKFTWPRKDRHISYLKRFPIRHKILSSDEFNNDLTTVSIAEWFKKGDDLFLTYSDTRKTAIINKILSISKPLKEYADIQRGVTPFNLTDSKVHPNSRRAFSGILRRYKLDLGPVRYIRYDKSLNEFKPERYFTGPRILLREMISRQFRLQAQLTETDFVNNKSIQSILPVRNSPNIEFLLGILNSHLISWFFLQKSNVGRRDDFPKIVLKETRLLPFCAIEPSNEKGISLANNISALVKDLNKVISRWSATTAPPAKENFHRQIEMLDKEIDRLVYKLYGLTEEEIKIVEEST